MNIYCTSDRIGMKSGGGVVTYNESQAFRIVHASLPLIIGRDDLGPMDPNNQPWGDDERLVKDLDNAPLVTGTPRLAHFYAGTWEETVRKLKERGFKVTYTAAAHDVDESRKEHEALGIPYNYPHLTDPVLLERYLSGYLFADHLIVPSKHSERVMRAFGYSGPCSIIPHGYDPPELPASRTSERFTVGYLGAVGPDKGLKYLLEAWRMLNYQDGSKLVLAGNHSNSSFVQQLISKVFSGHPDPIWIGLKGWVNDISDFYSGLNVYCQPSVSEGFGIEVLEAMAHGIPVVCSTGAGACDLIEEHGCGFRTSPRDVTGLAAMIDYYKKHPDKGRVQGEDGRKAAKNYTWDKIRERYVSLWRSYL